MPEQDQKVLALLPGQTNALRRLLLYQALPAKREYDASWDFSRPKEKYVMGGPAVNWYPDGRHLIFAADSGQPGMEYRPVWRMLTRLNVENPEKREILVR